MCISVVPVFTELSAWQADAMFCPSVQNKTKTGITFFLQRGICATFDHVTSTCKGKGILFKRDHWLCSVTLAEVGRKPSSTLLEMKGLWRLARHR